jgi:hypothetical protein
MVLSAIDYSLHSLFHRGGRNGLSAIDYSILFLQRGRRNGPSAIDYSLHSLFQRGGEMVKCY